MNPNINFRPHADYKIKEYEKLKSYSLDSKLFSKAIVISKELLIEMNKNFDHYIKRRGEDKKFGRKENKELKRLLIDAYPALKVIEDHKTAAVYWFRIKNPSIDFNKDIFGCCRNFRKDTGKWFTQVSESRINNTTDFLYVGKVQGALFNRFLQHIGLGHKYTTGLQMLHWATNLANMELEYQFYPVDNNYFELLADIEEVIWNNCLPLLGEGRIRNFEEQEPPCQN